MSIPSLFLTQHYRCVATLRTEPRTCSICCALAHHLPSGTSGVQQTPKKPVRAGFFVGSIEHKARFNHVTKVNRLPYFKHFRHAPRNKSICNPMIYR
ncbi:hypothetical protein ALO97_200005 [Pseudomonas syringae pv. tagetis]|nr:hypothetical protein ALO97_200005 [Pseudomonas syringae pv. tagetis]